MKTIRLPRGKMLHLKQGDITAETTDAIVNPANSHLRHGGGAALAIARAGGSAIQKQSQELIKKIGSLPVSHAVITDGGLLPAKFVIHTVGPIVQGRLTEKHCELLKSCYQSCLELAVQSGVKSIAFCCISTGEFHFPNDLAAEIAVRTVKEFLKKQTSVKKVIFNVLKDLDKTIYEKLLRAA